jgi:S-adenosylhomocysteine hydrolase
MKLTLEQKLKFVYLHVDDGVPICEIENKYGLKRSSLKSCGLFIVNNV